MMGNAATCSMTSCAPLCVKRAALACRSQHIGKFELPQRRRMRLLIQQARRDRLRVIRGLVTDKPAAHHRIVDDKRHQSSPSRAIAFKRKPAAYPAQPLQRRSNTLTLARLSGRESSLGHQPRNRHPPTRNRDLVPVFNGGDQFRKRFFAPNTGTAFMASSSTLYG